MRVTNPFIRPVEWYQRDLDIADGYRNQQAIILSLGLGLDYADCRNWVEEQIANHEADHPQPMVCVLERDRETGDRHKAAYPFLKYIDMAVKENNYLMGTFSQVLSKEQDYGELPQYTIGNIDARNREKRLQLDAQRIGDELAASEHNNGQNNSKRLNNSISGNTRSAFSNNHDRSAHPILTSSCRIANGSANSCNDRLLTGARHYFTADIALANIASVIELMDAELVADAILRHRLHVPTPEETLECILRSLSIYNKSRLAASHIWRVVRNMSDVQRAAVVYTGDLYHLMLHNDQYVRDFIDGLMRVPVQPVDDHAEWAEYVDGDTVAQIMVVLHDIVRDRKWGSDALKADDHAWKLGTLGHNIFMHLDHHRSTIEAFLVSRSIPFSTSYFPEASRQAGVASDTDSALFTVQDWVLWYSGNLDINMQNQVVAETFGYIVSEITQHNLTTLVANIGVIDPIERRRLSMKNEWLYVIFGLTPRAKHYYGLATIQEGVVLKHEERERKGVELIGSNLPPHLREELSKLMVDIVDEVKVNGMVDLDEKLDRVAQWEHEIIRSVTAGETTYLRAAKINEEEAYGDVKTRYLNYSLWEEVFAPKYGHVEPPPYSALSFSVVHDTKTKTEKWLNSWEDQEIAERMRKWLAANGKTYVGELLLPEFVILAVGIPVEILPALNIRKLMGRAMSSFYLVLQSLGYHTFDDKQTRLLSDYIESRGPMNVEVEEDDGEEVYA